MRSPISTEMKTTPKKAPAMAMKSPKSTFHILYMALKSMRPITALMMMDARMQFGRSWKRPVNATSTIITMSDITMFDTGVFTPAL